MKPEESLSSAQAWLARAYGNLAIAQNAVSIKGVFLEDLCFNAQQAAEKALKAVCIHHQIDFPRTHSIISLIDLLESSGILLPIEVKAADILTQYAVSPRYPGVSEAITKKEYHNVLRLSREVVS
jgi:HEPN domain-containing protein